LWYGVYKSQRISQNRAGLQQLFQLLPSLPFDDPATERFGEIRTHLNQQGTPIGPYDLQIAAIALTHELTLVTHNTREFARVPGLVMEDWLL
jgi:tRNA(fMet)-specific endonuclease VapC